MERKGYLYILQSTKSGRYYVGCCWEPDRRLEQHNSNANKATRSKGPWNRVALLRFPSLPAAKKSETWIKKMKSRRIIELIATASLQWKPEFQLEAVIETIDE